MPIPQEKSDEPGSWINDDQHGYQTPSTSPGKTDTCPRSSTAPVLQLFDPQNVDSVPVFHASTSYYDSNRTSAALTNTQQSMSSLPLSGSMKKGGGIRATFRKMFGSKRRRDSFSTGVHDQRSNSVSLLNNPIAANHRPLRKPSLLFEELIRGRALHSHAPNVISQAPTQVHSNVEEIVRPLVHGHSRRKSLPSVVLSSQDAQRLGLALNHQGIGSDYNAAQRPFKKTPNRSFINSVRRRSRSADALRDMAQSQNTLQAQERRLSDEIKYWRNSIIEDPIPSFTGRRQDVREEVGEARSTSTQTPTPPTRRPSEDATARPQGFSFNGLMIGNVDASVEQRITTVEVKLIDLECAIANLQGHQAAQRAVLGKPPRRRNALQDLSQQANARSASPPAIVPQSSFDSFSTGSSTSDDRQYPISEHRNGVANTLRPGAAAPSDASTAVALHPHPGQTPTEDEFARLVYILSQEQEARRGLEIQLNDLQKQINELRFPAPPRGPPTPGHFSTPTSSTLDSSPILTKRHTVLPFRTASPRLTLMMTSSQKENEGEETDTDDGFLDVYETPTEARDYGFEIDAPEIPPIVGVM